MKTTVKPLFLFSFIAVIGCGDTDKDGLTNAEESELGTDPESADSDGDGLGDYDEANELGTDPTKADTDGDGYLDPWEITEGTDPLDADSKIYIGGWPYQPNKEDGATTAEANLSVGASLARVELLDQFGEMVDLYDFSKQGVLTIVDVSAIWCGPCNGMAQWLSGQGDDYGWGQSYPSIAEKVHNGKVHWITVLGQDSQGNIPDVNDLAQWYSDYPDPNIPVLADTSDALFANSYLSGGWPTIFVLDGNMDVGVVPGGGNDFYKALDYIESIDMD
jgi:hypothetical protein